MDWIKQILRMILVMALQVLLFNQLQLYGLCRPYVYVLCLLMMPVTLPISVDMLIGMLLGLIMDIFCNSLGIHMSACVLVMFLRHRMLRNAVADFERLTGEIAIASVGMEVFIRYSAALILIHHAVVFLLSAWGWAHWGWSLMQILVSSFVTFVMVMLYAIVHDR